MFTNTVSPKYVFHEAKTPGHPDFKFSYETQFSKHGFEGMKAVREKVDQLAESLFSVKGNHRVVLKELEDHEWKIESGWNWRQLIPGFLHSFLSDSYKDENRATIQTLYQTFGYRRIQEIASRWGINVKKKNAHGLPLTRREVRRILIGLGDVRHSDMKEALRDIQSGHNPKRFFFTDAEYQSIFAHFADKTMDTLTKADCDLLYDLLTPFNRIESAFLNHVPKNLPDYMNRGFTMNGWKSIIYLNLEARRNPSGSNWQCRYDMMKHKLDYYSKKGAIFPMQDGYRYLQKRIEGGGAYALLLKSMNKVEGVKNVVAYLPTQFWCFTPDWWESLLEDFRPCIGSVGVKETYYDVHEYLTNPELGFVESDDEKFDVVGFSLGGAHVARIASLFYERVGRIDAICAAGVEDELLKEYAELSYRHPEAKKKIRVVFEGPDAQGQGLWDHVPFATDGYIGRGANPASTDIKTRVLIPGKPESPIKEIPTLPKATGNFLPNVLKFILSMVTSHNRYTIDGDYTEIVVDDTGANGEWLQKEVLSNENRGFEAQRSKFSHLFGKKNDFVPFMKEMRLQEERRRAAETKLELPRIAPCA